jgi:FixJ family two-component response regulator
VEPADLLKAVEAALVRDQSARTQNKGVSEATTRYAKLTERERSVFGHVIAGKLNKQIASALGISERTVKMHRAQVMSKMQAKSLPDLVHMAELLTHAGTVPRLASPQR